MAIDAPTNEYQDAISGATAVLNKPPRKKPAPRHDFGDGLGKVLAHRHDNGGGWVADTATVDDKVFVSRRAAVYHNAKITGSVRLDNHARVCGLADIDSSGSINDHVFVAGKTNITGHVVIRGYARLYGGKFVGRNEIYDSVRVQNNPTIRDCMLRETAFVCGSPQLTGTTVSGCGMIGVRANILKSTISGDVRIGGNALIVQSTLAYRNHYNSDPLLGCLLVTDSVKIVGVEAISALLHIKGHGTIVGGRISFGPYIDDHRQALRIECVDTLCIPNAGINTIPLFEAFNNPAAAQRQGTPHATLAAVQRPFNLENIVPRRRITPTKA
jgi:carbonic anhydrase/acetyltransferase-like protein (isoleucine patch superfamily)